MEIIYASIMKQIYLGLICVLLFVFHVSTVVAQEQLIKKPAISKTVEPDSIILNKFEPDFLLKNVQRKEKIAQTCKRIDSLDISERKRYKLLKDLYKNGMSKRLQEALLVGNKFEDVEE